MRRRFVQALHLIVVLALIFGGFARVPVAALGTAAAAAGSDCHSPGKKHTHHHAHDEQAPDEKAPDSQKSSMSDCCVGCCVPLVRQADVVRKTHERLTPSAIIARLIDPRGPPHRPPRAAA